MKKVLVAGAALMLVSGYASTVLAADYQDADLFAVHYPDTEKPAAVAPPPPAAIKPGVVLTGDARVRFWYKSEDWRNNFGNNTAIDSSSTELDSRVRLNITGTAAGGAYAKARIRLMEGVMGDSDVDRVGGIAGNDANIWADQAYAGVPFTDKFTLEVGKYRSTYGPLGTTYNFFYDDVNLTGARGIVKVGDIEINPFIEWMDEAQNALTFPAANDANQDNDEIRFGGHVKAKLNKDWTAGGMLGYQMDNRGENLPGTFTVTSLNANEGFFASIYTKGKSGAFGLVGEFAITGADLNGFNSWLEDGNFSPATLNSTTGAISTPGINSDSIGSDDTGFGGFVFPNYQIDKLNIGLNLGFTQDGFQPDRAFGFVMLGGTDNSAISVQRIGATGDWMWAGLVAEYSISEALKLTGNFVYADVDAWTVAGDGPGFNTTNAVNAIALENAWELSAVLQYTISKGADVYFSAGYLKPSLERVNVTGTPAALQEDGAFGALTRFELKF